MADSFETYRGMVYPWHIDHVGHMNVQFYTARFDEASWHFLLRLGFAPGKLKDDNRAFVAAQQQTQYFAEVMAGALLHVESELLEVKSRTLKYVHRMFNSESNVLVATMELVIIYLDTVARRAAPLPETTQLANARPATGPGISADAA